jgi:hypothetical protein
MNGYVIDADVVLRLAGERVVVADDHRDDRRRRHAPPDRGPLAVATNAPGMMA